MLWQGHESHLPTSENLKFGWNILFWEISSRLYSISPFKPQVSNVWSFCTKLPWNIKLILSHNLKSNKQQHMYIMLLFKIFKFKLPLKIVKKVSRWVRIVSFIKLLLPFSRPFLSPAQCSEKSKHLAINRGVESFNPANHYQYPWTR